MNQKTRLGVLLPATNAVMEPEMSEMAPEGVTVHFARLVAAHGPYPPGLPPKEREKRRLAMLKEFEEDLPRAARAVAMVQPKAIAFGCTSGSFSFGIEYEKQIGQSIREVTGLPGISTAGAARDALKELGLKKICLIGPYPDFGMRDAKVFLEANGFTVPVVKGLGLEILELNEQPPEVARDLALTTCRNSDCEGVFCSCTAFRTIEVLEEVEKDLGKPVVSANQATMWLLLKTVGFKRPVTGFGALLRTLGNK